MSTRQTSMTTSAWISNYIPQFCVDVINCLCPKLNAGLALQWRHNGHDSVSNHQPHACLLNRLFRRRSKKTPKLRVTGFARGIYRGPVNSPHKWPVTRKMFPFDDVIIVNLFPGFHNIYPIFQMSWGRFTIWMPSHHYRKPLWRWDDRTTVLFARWEFLYWLNDIFILIQATTLEQFS